MYLIFLLRETVSIISRIRRLRSQIGFIVRQLNLVVRLTVLKNVLISQTDPAVKQRGFL